MCDGFTLVLGETVDMSVDELVLLETGVIFSFSFCGVETGVT